MLPTRASSYMCSRPYEPHFTNPTSQHSFLSLVSWIVPSTPLSSADSNSIGAKTGKGNQVFRGLVPWYACSPHLWVGPLEAWSSLNGRSFIFSTMEEAAVYKWGIYWKFWVWRHMPLISPLRRQAGGSHEFKTSQRLHSRFQSSQSCLGRPYLKIPSSSQLLLFCKLLWYKMTPDIILILCPHDDTCFECIYVCTYVCMYTCIHTCVYLFVWINVVVTGLLHI